MATARGGIWKGIIKCDSYQAWQDWRHGSWHLVWCTLSICLLLAGQRQSEGPLYQALRDRQHGTMASFMMYAVWLSVCMLVAGRRQSEGRLYYASSFNCQSTFRFSHWRLITISGLKWLFIWTYFVKILLCIIKILSQLLLPKIVLEPANIDNRIMPSSNAIITINQISILPRTEWDDLHFICL